MVYYLIDNWWFDGHGLFGLDTSLTAASVIFLGERAPYYSTATDGLTSTTGNLID